MDRKLYVYVTNSIEFAVSLWTYVLNLCSGKYVRNIWLTIEFYNSIEFRAPNATFSNHEPIELTSLFSHFVCLCRVVRIGLFIKVKVINDFIMYKTT